MAGIFFPEGMQLRIPAGGLTLRVGPDGEVEAGPLRLELALDIWPLWLDVAMDHAATALEARTELVTAHQAAPDGAIDPSTQVSLLVRECKDSMVAIAAAAFALDNFYS